MLKEKKFLVELWAEVVNTSEYVLNQSFTKILKISTPYEKWSGRNLIMDNLRVFRSMVHVKTTKKVSKLEERSNVMIFIGYELGTKAYRRLDPLSFKVTISIDVIFSGILESGFQSTRWSTHWFHLYFSHWPGKFINNLNRISKIKHNIRRTLTWTKWSRLTFWRGRKTWEIHIDSIDLWGNMRNRGGNILLSQGKNLHPTNQLLRKKHGDKPWEKRCK